MAITLEQIDAEASRIMAGPHQPMPPHQRAEEPGTDVPERVHPMGNPLLSVFGEPPWEAEEREYEAEVEAWRRSSTETVDRAALEPVKFYEGKDLSFGRTPDEARMLATNDAYLSLAKDGDPLPPGIARDLLREEIALKQFAGRGADSDEAFHAEVVKDAQGRKDRRQLSEVFLKEANVSALRSVADPGAARGDWREVRKKIEGMPGYSAELEPEIYEGFRRAERARRDAMAPYTSEMREVWQSWQDSPEAGKATSVAKGLLVDMLPDGGLNEGQPSEALKALGKKSTRRTAWEIYDKLEPAEREPFVQALSAMAEALPEDQRPAYWANLAKQSGRDLESLAQGAVTGTVSQMQRGGTVGWEDFLGSDEAIAERNRKAAAVREKYRRQTDFVQALQSAKEAKFDPVKYLGEEGSWLRRWEKISYGTPGVLATSLAASTPYTAPALFTSLTEMHYQSVKDSQMEQGASYEDASRFATEAAPVAAMLETVSEAIGARLLRGKLPVLDKTLTRLMDRIRSTPLRLGVRFVASGTESGLQEVGQNYIDPLLEALGHETGAAKYGAGKVAWADNVDAFTSVFPLALLGLRGAMGRDARVKAFEAASDEEILATGVTRNGLRSIRDGIALGLDSGDAAITTAFQDADPASESAKTASAAVAEQAADRAAALEKAKATGMVPTIVQSRTADGISYTVLDGESKEVVGTAPDMPGAMRLASAHSAFLDDQRAEKVAYLATMLEGGAEALEMDRSGQGRNDFGLGTVYTEAVAAAEDASSIDQFREQAETMEQINGGSGNITMVALGRNVAEVRDQVRTWTNRLFAGASVQTIVHETGHGMLRRLEEAGEITRADKLAFVRAVDGVMGGRKLKRGALAGRSLALLPEGLADAEVTDGMLNEGISHILEAELLRTRKLAKDDKAVKLSPGIISRNLLALAQLAPGATRKFRAFIEAARGVFGLSSAQALAITKGLREGTLDAADYQGFLDKLTGRDLQAEHDGMAREEAAELLDVDAPFSMVPSPRETVTERVTRAAAAEPLEASTDSWRGISPRERRDRAVSMAKTLQAEESGGKPLINADRNRAVHIGVSAMKHWASFSADPRKAALIDHLRELLSRSIFLRSEKPDARKEVEPNIRGFHRLALPARIDGSEVVAIVVVRQDNAGNYVYDGRVLEVETPADGDLTSRESESTKGEDSAHLIRQAREEAINDHLEVNKALASEDAFSLAPSAMVHGLEQNAIGLIRNPLKRAQAYQRLSRKLQDLRLGFERLELVAGAKRRKGSLKKEAAMREALRREELVEDAMRRHEQVFSNADLTKLKAQPVHAHLADPDSPLRGRLMGKAAALKRHPDMFQVNRPGDYDGADGISRAVFGGTLMPDQAAQELYEAHLIPEPTPDALWEAIAREQSFVEGMKEYHAKALEAVREAKAQAKQETNEWLKQQGANQQANFSDKQEILRALAVLDGVLSVAPAEIRGKVGGYTQLARLGSNENRMEFLKERLAMVDKAMEDWLKKQYHAEFMDLLKRAKPSKDAPGEKPTGKLGADLHDFFQDVEKAMRMTSTEADAEAAKLEALAASGDYSADEEAHKNTLAGLIRLVGAWYPRHELQTNPATGAESYREVYAGADAARMEEALIEATRIFEKGYWESRIEAAKKREARTKTRRALEAATGKQGTPGEGDDQDIRDAGLLTSWGKLKWSLASFDQLMVAVFGETSAEARRYADAERWANDRKSDAINLQTDAITELFTELAGGALEGEKLRWEMARKVHKVGGRTLSEMEMITATLMWRQEDGRRHMLGHQDDLGNYVGKWHYDQAFIDEVEGALSPEAKAVRLHLSDRYAAEYDRLNAVYRRLYGVNLPRHQFYSPLTVVPQQVEAHIEPDPVTGFQTGGGFTPGSLKTRSADAIAQPEFRDAVQTYIAHVKQMEHWMAYAGLTQEMNMVLKNRDLRDAIKAKAGVEAFDVMSQWVKHFSLGGNRDAGAQMALSQKLTKWTNRAASIALVGRAGVLAIQSVQLGAGLAEMPTGAYLKRLGMLTSGQLHWGQALQTAYIQRRMKDLPPIVRQGLEGLRSTKPNRLKHEVAKLGQLIGGADALFTAGTYAICYDYHLKQGLKNGLSQAEAEKAADTAAERACDRIAQPTRAGARSLYENTQTGPLAKLGWAFGSEARQKLALAAFTMANPDASAGRKARALAVTWLVGGGLATLIRSAWRDMRDDDDDEWFDERNWNPYRLGLSMLTGPLQGLPVIGDMIEAGLFAYFHEYLPEGNLFTPFARVPGAVEHVPEWFTGERDLEDALKDAEAILSGIGILNDTAAAGASALHVARDLFGLVENVTTE